MLRACATRGGGAPRRRHVLPPGGEKMNYYKYWGDVGLLIVDRWRGYDVDVVKCWHIVVCSIGDRWRGILFGYLFYTIYVLLYYTAVKLEYF